jgi:hypothetical protein
MALADSKVEKALGLDGVSELLQGLDGALYGVNGIGGNGGHGTISCFKLNPHAPGPVASITVNPTVVHSGQSSTGTVILSSPAPAEESLSHCTQQGQIVIPATVKVPAGATATFTIKALKIGGSHSKNKTFA